jgi:membrane protein
MLSRHINRAWPDAEPRGLLERRLVALGMVGSLVLLLILSLGASTAVSVVSRTHLPLAQDTSIFDTAVWTWSSNLIPLLVTVLLFAALYRWVPDAAVPWRAALLSGLVAGLAWELAGDAFAWYVSSGMASYNLVYGSLGAVVALMFWIYLGGWIILFGAHLSAAMGRRPAGREFEPAGPDPAAEVGG